MCVVVYEASVALDIPDTKHIVWNLIALQPITGDIHEHTDTTRIKFVTHTTGGTLSALTAGPSLFALIVPFFESLIAGKDLKGDLNIVMNRWFLLSVNRPLSGIVFLCNTTRSN